MGYKTNDSATGGEGVTAGQKERKKERKMEEEKWRQKLRCEKEMRHAVGLINTPR